MDRQRVLDALEVLRTELASSPQVSDEARTALGRVADDIGKLAADEAGKVDESASGLHDALQEFGAEHPHLAGAINQVAAALANLGI